METKIEIKKNKKHSFTIKSSLEGQELYEAYVALTAHIATKLKNPEAISQMAMQASKDALQMLNPDIRLN